MERRARPQCARGGSPQLLPPAASFTSFRDRVEATGRHQLLSAAIVAAQDAAQPGDTLLLHAGAYGGRISFSKPGTATTYIAWKAAGDGEVELAGIDVAASHIWLEGLTVSNLDFGLLSLNSPTNVVVSRCRFLNNHYGIFLRGAGTNWYIADNTIVGDTPAASESLSGEGIDLNTTSGHTVAHNSITNVADGISYPYSNVDIYGNDVFDTSDDGIELDYGSANVRVWANRIHNAVHNGISFQPQAGAPWYIVRNQIVGNVESAFKFRTTDRFVLLHNTIVNWGDAWPGSSLMCCNEWDLLRAFARNNLWITAKPASEGGAQIWGFETYTRDWRSDLDYDGFDWGPSVEPFTYGGIVFPDVGFVCERVGPRAERHRDLQGRLLHRLQHDCSLAKPCAPSSPHAEVRLSGHRLWRRAPGDQRRFRRHRS